MSKGWEDKSQWLTHCQICFCAVTYQLMDFHLQYHEIKDKQMSIYDLNFTDNKGKVIELGSLKDKVILLVNVASNCGFTKQYTGLQQLHASYAADGLEVIGFPCNQFGGQEPGTDQEIEDFCKTNYDVGFTIATKSDVKGENAHPIYKYIQEKTGKEIQWNFEKFLIDKGDIVAYGNSDLPVISLEPQIIGLLDRK
jgi:glutathione peroxidase